MLSNVLEKVKGFKSEDVLSTSSDGVFDVKTPEGAFFNALHNRGYAMYEGGGDSLVYTELYKALCVKGNQVINAVAGAGKTTALVLKVLHDVVTGESLSSRDLGTGHKIRVVDSVWVCTFLRSGAEELKSAMGEWLAKLKYNAGLCDGVVYSTMDAEFRRCLIGMGVMPNIGSPEVLNKIFTRVVNDLGITRQGRALTRQDYRLLSEIVTYVRGRLDTQRYNHPGALDYGLSMFDLKNLVESYAVARQKEGVMDFEEVMELLYKYLYTTPNPKVQEYVRNRYKYIYIDEFQDTSQIAYAILKFYASGSLGKLVVVGDPSQCIYSFRGSDSRILKQSVLEDFSPTLTALSVNYRCPAGILDAVVPSIHKNSDSADQRIVANHAGGRLRGYSFKDLGDMSTALVSFVKADLAEGMDVVILCRTNFDGVLGAASLANAGGVDFSISGEDMTLSSHIARSLAGFTQLITDSWGTGAVSALKLLVPKSSEYALKRLGDVLRTNGLRLWNLDLRDIEESCPDLLDFVKYLQASISNFGGTAVERDLYLLRAMFSYVDASFTTASMFSLQARGVLSFFESILDKHGVGSVHDFLYELNYLSDYLKGCVRKSGVRVRFATVHEYKGKQADSVYIWNDSEGSFPAAKTDMNVLAQVEEERRVHYIACTRSKKSLTVLSLSGRSGKFLKEMPLRCESWVSDADLEGRL